MDHVGTAREPPARLVFLWLYIGDVAAAYGVFLLTMISLLVADTLSLGEAGLGIAFASLSVGGLASPFVSGVFADRAGPRPIMLTGLLSVCAGSLLAALSPASWTFVIGQFLVGAGFSMYGVMAYSWINESLGSRKGAYLGLFVTAIVSGTVLSGISVAFLLPHVPSWRDFYFLSAAVVLVPAAILAVLLPSRMGVPSRRKDLRRALKHRDVRWVAGLQYLIGLGGAGYIWIPLFLVQDRALGLQVAVLVFVGASAMWGLSGMWFGRLADEGWSKPLIVFGGLGTGATYLAFVLWPWLPATVAFLFLYAFLWPAGAQVPFTFLGHRLGHVAQRTELGLSENLFLAGDATGAALIGFLAESWTLTWALALIPGVVTLAAGVLFAWAYGLRREPKVQGVEGSIAAADARDR